MSLQKELAKLGWIKGRGYKMYSIYPYGNKPRYIGIGTLINIPNEKQFPLELRMGGLYENNFCFKLKNGIKIGLFLHEAIPIKK